jgi:Xaa-Pro dipeptidase
MDQQIVARIRRRLQGRGVDAYLAYTPANVLYTSGFESWFVMEWWRWHGGVLVLVPADESLALGMVVSDFEAGPARASGIDDIRSHGVWVELVG